MQTLAKTPAGSTVRITDIEGDDAIAMRMMEMGVLEGEVISVVGRAPLGDPIEVSVRGYRLSLRQQEAERIAVEPEPNETPNKI
ncbi:MAG: ferrous iron transport protein A [Pirellulaceae bacterium]